jgi:small subunit ribosomal protein S17
MEPKARNSRKTRVGVVVSDKMDKTIGVRVERRAHHSMYMKAMKKFTTFKAHDEKREAKVGDVVSIVETRPLSKTKRWRLVQVLEKAR